MEYKAQSDLDAHARAIWEKHHGKELNNKERIALPQQPMPQLPPQEAVKDMRETELGYSPIQAKAETLRCLQCANKPCQTACPVHIDIPAFIKALEEERNQDAIDIIHESSLLPAVCGRVCPHEWQCMGGCTVGKVLKDPMQSVAIGALERFAADWEASRPHKAPHIAALNGKSVAIVGGGPSGITAAADLARIGYHVEIFERFHTVGGVLVYGIPEFVLPNRTVEREIENLKAMGVIIHTDFTVDKEHRISDLLGREGFDAVYLAMGARKAKALGIPGEELPGVMQANPYLALATRADIYENERRWPVKRGAHVAVLGAGNVAVDAARAALRLGAAKASIIYRRTEKESPARIEELSHAKAEGIEFLFLTQPIAIKADETGRAQAVVCQKCLLGEADASGRARSIPQPGSEFEVPADLTIVAIGSEIDPSVYDVTGAIELQGSGAIKADETGRTNVERVYAGGDLVLGPATVILAMGFGRKSAAAIHEDLTKTKAL